MLSHVRLFATIWPVALHAPLSMGFFRPEYWNGISSKGSSWPRDLTHVSWVFCVDRWILYHWTIREVWHEGLGGSAGKELTCQYRRCEFDPWVRKVPWSGEGQPAPVFLPGKFHGQRSPWGCKELDTTEGICTIFFVGRFLINDLIYFLIIGLLRIFLFLPDSRNLYLTGYPISWRVIVRSSVLWSF